MTSIRQIGIVTVVSALAGAALLGGSANATTLTSAAVSVPTAALAGTLLPSCVKVRHTSGITTQTVYVTNNCHIYSIAWYVDKEGPNSQCFYLPTMKTASYKWSKRDVYHGTYDCW